MAAKWSAQDEGADLSDQSTVLLPPKALHLLPQWLASQPSPPPGEQLAGAIPHEVLQPIERDQGLRAGGGNLLDRLASTDRLHGILGLDLGAMGASLACYLGATLMVCAPPMHIRVRTDEE